MKEFIKVLILFKKSEVTSANGYIFDYVENSGGKEVEEKRKV